MDCGSNCIYHVRKCRNCGRSWAPWNERVESPGLKVTVMHPRLMRILFRPHPHQSAGHRTPGTRRLQTVFYQVPADRTATAMHGDRVLVRREASGPPSRKPQAHEFVGKLVRVLESARTRLVGTLQRSRQFLYVIPDDTRIPHDIYVPPARDLGRDRASEIRLWWNSKSGSPATRIPKVK